MTEFFETCLSSIMLQETSLRNTIEAIKDENASLLNSADRIILTGCGDSYAAAAYGNWCLLALGIDSVLLSPSEIVHTPVKKGTLVIGITASGRSLATIDALDYARNQGARVVALTDDPQGPICKHVDEVWITKSGVSSYNTSPSAPTTAAMVFMLALVSRIDGGTPKELNDDVLHLKVKGEEIIKWAQKTGQNIASVVDSSKIVYLVGEGPNHVAAQIGMMKFDEYSIVKGIAAKKEEFRHHYNLSIKDGEPVVVITDTPSGEEDSIYLKVMSDTLKMGVYHLHAPTNLGLQSALAQAIPNMIAMQFAAYYSAVKLDPEKTGFKEPHASSFKIY